MMLIFKIITSVYSFLSFCCKKENPLLNLFILKNTFCIRTHLFKIKEFYM